MKRISLVFLTMFFLLVQVSAQTSDAVQQYIDKYKEIAINEEIRTGVPASITLAQGIFESMAGQSDLALASNNHFGIKCKETWTGAKVYHDDDARGECFRKYVTVEESYRDHSDFLRTRLHYAFLFDLNPTDYEAWAHGLKKAGYATNPAYAKAIIKRIEENGLQQYTLLALQRTDKGDQDLALNNSGNMPVITAAVTSLPDETAAAVEDKPIAVNEVALIEYTGETGDYPLGIFIINKTKVIYAGSGSSLFALSENNKIPLEKLKEYNEWGNGTGILSNNQLVYLEKKPKKSENRDYHIVAQTETIEAIAQKEGVQLESLFEYNKMQKGLQPAPGEKIYLKPGRQPYYPKLLPKTAVKIG
jgi:LysM repeat protein